MHEGIYTVSAFRGKGCIVTLSLSVIAFQVAIILTVVGVGYFWSKDAALQTAFMWGLWTLLKVTLLSPLFFLQFATILISFGLGTILSPEFRGNSKRESDEREGFHENLPLQPEKNEYEPAQQQISALHIRRESGPKNIPALLHVYKIVGRNWIKVSCSLTSPNRQPKDYTQTREYAADISTLYQAILPFWVDPDEVEQKLHAAMLKNGFKRMPLSTSTKIFSTPYATYGEAMSFLSYVLSELVTDEEVKFDLVTKEEYWLPHRPTEHDQASWINIRLFGGEK